MARKAPAAETVSIVLVSRSAPVADSLDEFVSDTAGSTVSVVPIGCRR